MLLQAKNTYFVVKIKKRKKGITLYNYLFLKFKQLLRFFYEQQKESDNHASKYLENTFGKIYELGCYFISLLDSYFPFEKDDNPVPTEEQNTNSKENIEETQTIQIEPDMIFRTNMFDKFLLLEKKLIVDKYLDKNLNWISKHDNGIIDRKRLVSFLVGLMENRYFLPNKDPKIRIFFENRYNIKIGQNFERSRRTTLIDQYKITFLDYLF